MSSYDSPWKEALDLFLRPLLAFLFPKVEADVDWSQDYESLEQELRPVGPEGELGTRLADKLIKVRTLSGDERVLNVEVQAQPKKQGFERRVYVYNYRSDDRFNLPPESLVVLADEDAGWRPTTYEVRLHYVTLTFTFEPAKLLDWSGRKDELRGHQNPMGLFVLAHLEAQRTHGNIEERARVKLDLLLQLAARRLDEDEMRQWYRLLDWFLDLPEEIDVGVYREAKAQVQEKIMPYVSFADRYERKEGKKEGKIEGEIKGMLIGLRPLLRVKFGAAGEALMPTLEKIDDPGRLAAVVDVVEQASNLEELLVKLAPPKEAP